MLRPSALLLAAVVLLPVALIPGSNLVHAPGGDAAHLSESAAALAGQISALLAERLPASDRREEALRRPAEACATGPGSGAAACGQATPGADLLIAALAALPHRDGLDLTLRGTDGRILARQPIAADSAERASVAAEHPVEGWPLRLQVTMPAAAPAAGGASAVIAAMLAMLALAAVTHGWERQAAGRRVAAVRRDAARSASLAEREAQLRLALTVAKLGCWSWDEAQDRLDWDPRAAAILGWQANGGASLAELRLWLDPADQPLLDDAILHARRTHDAAQCALRLTRPSDGARRWIELRAQAAPGATGLTWHGVVADITAQREAEEQQRLLLREVDHRARNTLAVVQAVLRLTRTEDPVGFLPRVEGRIAALAHAHTLLAQSRWQGAELRRLIGTELARHGGTPTLSGPPAMLAPQAVQPVAMVLHELASHAARQGPLNVEAVPAGASRIEVHWTMQLDGGLRLVWQESGTQPAESCIGNRILEATVRDQLGGRITRTRDATGFRCDIMLPAGCIIAA